MQKNSTSQCWDTVMIPLLPQDRGRLDPRNVPALVINDNASSTFQLCTKSEVLDHWHTRNQFEPIREKLLKEEDVNLDKTISLREASRGQSATGSLGAVIKCFCGSACSTKRCNCFKAKLKCNSRCHNKRVCANRD